MNAHADGAGVEADRNPGVPWAATDALGRTLPTSDEVGPIKPGRFVGIFYFLWLNERGNKSPQGNHPYDISKILAADPDALKKPDSPLWGPIGRAHYWGESLYGYYLSNDAWVIRKHAQLLADAGVDTLIFDATNAATYKDVYMKLCEVYAQIRKDGGRTPQFAFMLNSGAKQTADELYRDLYQPGLYPELWFKWDDKPLLICDPKEASEDVKNFFTLRKAHWPLEMKNTENAWHWEATYPQPYGYTDDPNKPEQVNVSVAQNLGAYGKHSVQNMSSGKARGRGYHDGKQDPSPGAIENGLNFAEQWKRALELDPPMVMVTGWNEWIAGHFSNKREPVAFVDQFDQEYSRDIEPVKGLHGDNFYNQLIAGIRKYKGMAPLPVASPAKTIRMNESFADWSDVGPEFTDHVGDTAPRDFDGAANLHYTDASGRNDIVASKVARDADNVYFYLRTREPLKGGSPPAGLWLMIDADRNAKTGWEGFDFIVNRMQKDGSAMLEKHAKDWEWTECGKVQIVTKENELQLKIPRKLLGVSAGKIDLEFKWADNLQKPGDVMDFYVSGDVAPEGRMRYRYAAD